MCLQLSQEDLFNISGKGHEPHTLWSAGRSCFAAEWERAREEKEKRQPDGTAVGGDVNLGRPSHQY